MTDISSIIVITEVEARAALLPRVAYRSVLVRGIGRSINEGLFNILLFLVIAKDANVAVCQQRRIVEWLRAELVHFIDQCFLVFPRAKQVLDSLLMKVSVLGPLGAATASV